MADIHINETSHNYREAFWHRSERSKHCKTARNGHCWMSHLCCHKKFYDITNCEQTDAVTLFHATSERKSVAQRVAIDSDICLNEASISSVAAEYGQHSPVTPGRCSGCLRAPQAPAQLSMLTKRHPRESRGASL